MSVVDVGWLQKLVATPTLSGNGPAQRAVMESIIDRLRAPSRSFSVEADLDGPHPWALVDSGANPEIPRLLFAAHVDTVPPGELASWDRDPFGAELDHGVVHGRGSADMLGGLVAATSAVGPAFDAGCAVALLLTSDEEVGSLGASAAGPRMANLNVGAVVVPEPTGGQIHLGHRGALWLEVTTAGLAAHGSTPDRGVNAILKACAVLGRAGASLPLQSDAFLGAETWNVGTVAGGSVPNVVPSAAQFVVDHRTIHDGESLAAWWRTQPETESVRARVALPPVRTPADSPWLATLPGPASPMPVRYFTDASALVPHLRGAPVVIWGPGQASAMHAANEAVSVAEVEAAAHSFTQVALAWRSGDPAS